MRKLPWVILLLLLVQCKARNQPVSKENKQVEEIDTLVKSKATEFLSQSKSPGLIVAISRDGKRSYYGYGYADPGSKKEFTSKTIFEIGSISKTFTANLLWQLMEEKKLNATTPVGNYLKLDHNYDSSVRNLLISDIAKHNSGLPRLPGNLSTVKNFSEIQPYQAYSDEELFNFLRTVKQAKPGTFLYSNLGFGLLGVIAEQVTGKALETLYQEYIFSPLDMKNTYVHVSATTPDSATGHINGNKVPYWKFDALAGAGAIKSNAEDLLNYLEAHIKTGKKKFAMAANELTTNLTDVRGPTKIGYSWFSMEDLSKRVYWHNGGTYGFSTFAGFEPTTKTAIVIASNSFQVNNHVDKMAHDLLDWLIRQHEGK